MPTYDYKCDKCGHELEIFQSITAKPLKKCPECGKKGLRRLVGAGAAVIFKGSGFYCTDYRKGSPGPPTEKPPDSRNAPTTSESGDSKTSSGSDAKENG